MMFKGGAPVSRPILPDHANHTARQHPTNTTPPYHAHPRCRCHDASVVYICVGLQLHGSPLEFPCRTSPPTSQTPSAPCLRLVSPLPPPSRAPHHQPNTRRESSRRLCLAHMTATYISIHSPFPPPAALARRMIDRRPHPSCYAKRDPCLPAMRPHPRAYTPTYTVYLTSSMHLRLRTLHATAGSHLHLITRRTQQPPVM
ncbi:hypothetical protein IWZ03DRAFT_23996 [Phyllosticta citriasiana]|uniref:Uncharacterized protein n=1 Tax=Phyllosticta citriasiana TaxID=595635 RepID=A0ABR1KZX7_9PEZI